MAPIVLTLLQVAFLLLLYLFVWFTARAIMHDLRPRRPAAVGAPVAAPSPARPPPRPAARTSRGSASELVVHAAGAPPRVLRLGGSDISFGRSAQSTVVLDDSYSSERHARVYREGEQWLLSDLGSTNGTFLNKARVDGPTPIGPGDQIAIGKTVVEVRK